MRNLLQILIVISLAISSATAQQGIRLNQYPIVLDPQPNDAFYLDKNTGGTNYVPRRVTVQGLQNRLGANLLATNIYTGTLTATNSGTVGSIVLNTNTVGTTSALDLIFRVGNFNRWRIRNTWGTLEPNVHELYDIGTNTARVRKVYSKDGDFSGQVVAPTLYVYNNGYFQALTVTNSAMIGQLLANSGTVTNTFISGTSRANQMIATNFVGAVGQVVFGSVRANSIPELTTFGGDTVYVNKGSNGVPGRLGFGGDVGTGWTGPIITAGEGSPEGVVTAPRGSIYLRWGGGANTSFYVKTADDFGDTGWVAK